MTRRPRHDLSARPEVLRRALAILRRCPPLRPGTHPLVALARVADAVEVARAQAEDAELDTAALLKHRARETAALVERIGRRPEDGQGA